MFRFHVFQKFYSQPLAFQIAQSAQKLTLLAQGQGLEPRLEFNPSVLELGPLLPYAPGDEAEVVVKNPCDFPIEFYSLEFDQQYLMDEKVSRSQNQPPVSLPMLCPAMRTCSSLCRGICFLTFTLSSPCTLPGQFEAHFVAFSDLPDPEQNSLLLCDLIIHFEQPIEKPIYTNSLNLNSEEYLQKSLF